ncbi:MAG: hypothetical protein AB7P01_18825 [Bacteroidia bacterium]
MENLRIESELTALRGDVVMVGAAVVGILLLNAFILNQIANDLHEMRKEKLKEQLREQMEFDDEPITATDKVVQDQPVKEQSPVKETKTEDEKQ